MCLNVHLVQVTTLKIEGQANQYQNRIQNNIYWSQWMHRKCLLKPPSPFSYERSLSHTFSLTLYHLSLPGRETIEAVAHDLSTAPFYVEVKNVIAAWALSLPHSFRSTYILSLFQLYSCGAMRCVRSQH